MRIVEKYFHQFNKHNKVQFYVSTRSNNVHIKEIKSISDKSIKVVVSTDNKIKKKDDVRMRKTM